MSTGYIPFQAIVALDETRGIGKNGSIPWHIPEDLKFFHDVTTQESKKNMVVMGRKTWESIPNGKRPLKNRINVILSREYAEEPVVVDTVGTTTTVFGLDATSGSIEQVEKLARRCNVDIVFVIGGESVYRMFARRLHSAYVTLVRGTHDCDVQFPAELVRYKRKLSLKNYQNPSCEYEIWYYGSDIPGLFPRFVADKAGKPVQNRNVHHDRQYLDLLKYVLDHGKTKNDRTGTGTISCFAPMPLRFDVSQFVPLLTTKKMAWKGIVKELLWFFRGDTDAKILQKQGVHIWDGNSSREFLDRRGLAYEEGVIGPCYGWQFRRSGASYDERYADAAKITPETNEKLGGVDQLTYVENLLKGDPDSRRIYMNLWNPSDLDSMALTPCHCGIQFYSSIDERDARRKLSCHVYIRSNDLFLGNPYNIFSYAAFLYVMAKRCDMDPNELVVSFGDAHIYLNHLRQVREQLDREPFPSPSLTVSDAVCDKDWSELDVVDFSVDDYESHPSIRAPMAV